MLDFGIIQIGKTLEEELIISNFKSVYANFSIERKALPGNQP